MQSGPLKFGIFMAPFHPAGQNPTLALERDLELLQWLDTLGYDEAWIEEHHSAGWELIASPEIFIATAAERTRHIRLGTGVVSLPYHNPYMVAERMVLLDHLTRGRVLFGCVPGALYSDAHMLGLDPTRQREMMDEAMSLIIRLFTEDEPISYESDWIKLVDARLHFKPYQRPYPPMYVASQFSPAGPQAAGKHGAGLLSLGTFSPGGITTIPRQWEILEEEAQRYGKTVSRADWRLMAPIYVAETREQAFADVAEGAVHFLGDYFGRTLGRPMAFEGPPENALHELVETGGGIVGTPEDAVAFIERLDEESKGGFGGVMALGHEWTTREKVLKSYELIAKYVMPRFNGQAAHLLRGNQWAADRSAEMFGREAAAIQAAFAKHQSGA